MGFVPWIYGRYGTRRINVIYVLNKTHLLVKKSVCVCRELLLIIPSGIPTRDFCKTRWRPTVDTSSAPVLGNFTGVESVISNNLFDVNKIEVVLEE